tara:strand:+ start:612 stop:1484 length:873 start_codon:yes stop_codon:yes gene_type:complete
MTCDVEEHSIEKNTLDDNIIPLVHKQGLPRLLDLFDKYKINCTFFFTGYYALKSPESLRLVKAAGHEIGCHSFSHHPDLALDRLTFRQQFKEISKSKKIIEDIVGPIDSFRAPALRINKYTFEVLIALGFKFDSSLCPRRFDGPFSSGFRKKLKWLSAKEGIYDIKSKLYPDRHLTEVPISANILPYIGTLSRISPELINALRPRIFNRSEKFGLPVVFDTHPNECVDIQGIPFTTRRSKNFLKYLFSDILRHKLKLKNLGKNAIYLLENEINEAKKFGFKFRTVNQMRS